MFRSKEQQFFNASAGDLSVVKKLVADPKLNKKWQGQLAYTHSVMHAPEIVSVVEFLLTLPNIDVNKPNNNDATPFLMACENGQKEVVSLPWLT